jgi:hypothetical protein
MRRSNNGTSKANAMHDLLFGNWAAQIGAFCKQQPLQTIAAAMTTLTVVMTLMLGVRGTGSGDSGGITSGDGDGGDGGCGGE